MLAVTLYSGSMPSRSPHGERGLKYQGGIPLPVQRESLPPRGAWIEIAALFQQGAAVSRRAPLVGGALFAGKLMNADNP